MVLGLAARTSAERAELAAGRARAATRVAAAERFLDERPHLAAALLRGVAPEDALGSIRLTLGRSTTDDDVIRAADVLVRSWKAVVRGEQATSVAPAARTRTR